MQDPEEDSREELVQRFREDLRRPLSERYYSEEELLSIFDVAGDQYDDYVRMEALLLGARLYPESSELQARRAIFYRDYDAPTLQSYLRDNRTDTTALLEIMRLSQSGLSGDEAREAADKFLSTHSLGEDEEVIQFVQMVHALDIDDWLIENLARVKEKVSYLPSLLYEIAILSDESPAFSNAAVKVLEELTEIEPYSAEYWVLLSMVYSREGRYEDALTAIDYALAIDPDNIEALKARLRALAEKPDSPEIGSLLERIGDADPNDADFAYIRVSHAEEQNDIPKILSLIESFPPAVRATRPIVLKAIQYGYDKTEELMETVYDAGMTDENEWNQLAELAFTSHNIQALTDILRVYERKSGGQSLDHAYIDYRMLFRLGKYELAMAIFTNSEVGGAIRTPDNFMTAYAMYVMMLLREGHTDEAAEAAKTIVNVIDSEPMMPGNQVEKYGVKMFMNDILKRLKSVRKTDWQRYNPLNL